jgi:hypothetical protein
MFDAAHEPASNELDRLMAALDDAYSRGDLFALPLRSKG